MEHLRGFHGGRKFADGDPGRRHKGDRTNIRGEVEISQGRSRSFPSLVVYRGVVYMLNDSGVLTTLNAETGEVLKQARLRAVSDRYFASPVAADGKIFIAANSGVV